MTDTGESLRRKIGSAGELQAVVRTMKAMAASSVGQYLDSARALADYYRTVELGLGACFRASALTAPNGGPKSSRPAVAVRAIVFGSDQGLVGQFNDLVADRAIETIGKRAGAAEVWAVGERVQARLAEAGLKLAGVLAVPHSVQTIAPLIAQLQVETEARHPPDDGELWLFHNRPRSGSAYEPVGRRLLPLDSEWQRDLANRRWPSARLPQILGGGATTLRALLHEYLFITLFRACAESLASENASRMAAMERAEKNIGELLEQLQGNFNRLRQSGIDEELFDVVSGFDALAGSRRRA